MTAAADRRTERDRTGRGRPEQARPRWSRDRVETVTFGVLRWVVIVVLVLVTAFPFYYMVVLSVRTLDEVVARPALLWPQTFDWSTYANVLAPADAGGQGFLVFLRNSAILAVLTVLFTLFAAIPGAYAISRLEFFGRRQVSALFLAVYLFPAILLAVPLFVFFSAIGLRGSLVGLVVVYVAQTVPISIYLLRNYMAGLPKEIMESARIDGASHFKIFTGMVLPLSFPALASFSIFQFLWVWNDLLVAMVFLGAQEGKLVLTGKLVSLLGSRGNNWEILTAGAFVTIVVPLIVFFSLQRYFVRGLLAGSVK